MRAYHPESEPLGVGQRVVFRRDMTGRDRIVFAHEGDTATIIRIVGEMAIEVALDEPREPGYETLFTTREHLAAEA